MPSSPAESAELQLQLLTRLYDQAYEALVRDDVDRVGALLHETEALLAQIGNCAVPTRTRDDALAAHGRLQSAMRRAHTETGQELAQVRTGCKVLHGYAASADHLGQRLESRG